MLYKSSFFVGQDLEHAEDDPEFYKRGSLVDVGYGAGTESLFTATDAQPVTRVRWQITQDALIARLAYERISGTDGKGNKIDGTSVKATNDGQIVARYKIASHFDIKRDYNPQTGEELNIVVENENDRPWYAREYMRVDWSTNQVTDAYDYDTLAATGVFDAIKYDPIGYTVLDPADPDAPHSIPKRAISTLRTRPMRLRNSSTFHAGAGARCRRACSRHGFAEAQPPWGTATQSS